MRLQSLFQAIGIFLIGTSIAFGQSTKSQEQRIESMVDSLVPSVCYFQTKGEAWGCGVLLNDSTCITNVHVLESLVERSFELSDFDLVSGAGVRLDIEAVKRFDIDADWAILSVRSSDSVDFEVPSLVISRKINLGAGCIAIGAPYGFQNSISVGVISYVDRFDKRLSSIPLAQHTAGLLGGSSGGPLFNFQAQLIGINFARIPSFGFAIPISAVALDSQESTNVDFACFLDYMKARQHLQSTYWFSGHPSSALQLAQKCVVECPNFYEACLLAARAASQLGYLDSALAYVDEAVRVDGQEENLEAILLRGQIYLENDDIESARVQLVQLIEHCAYREAVVLSNEISETSRDKDSASLRSEPWLWWDEDEENQ